MKLPKMANFIVLALVSHFHRFQKFLGLNLLNKTFPAQIKSKDKN